MIFLTPFEPFIDKETDTQEDEIMLSVSSSTRNQTQVYLNPKFTS